ncbi:hypothetical protein HPB50_012743 [Hyalomma asiaticum]|uniref:Uncharacterized protein n=1 Tax=Hyalomma asiaticum TaxID=266040 RepID=A0ACB7TH90_HYAAI|nr:hypothetical protein HPB50_012743 [Hyalomma asiaticum]
MILASAADKRLSELAEVADSVLAVAPPSVAALQPDIAGRAPTTALHDIREHISRLADTVPYQADVPRMGSADFTNCAGLIDFNRLDFNSTVSVNISGLCRHHFLARFTKLSSSTAAAHSCVGRPEAPAPSAPAALGSPTPKMASASSQLNAAVTHNRFAALAMEDMELGAYESNNTTAPSRTTEVLNNAGRTAVAVQGSDLKPRDTAGWKFTATKQVSQIQLQPQASKDTQNKSTSQFSESQAKNIVARVTKSSRLPVNLPKEEQKIIMRPRGGLCLARLEVDVVLSAVITAASVTKTEAMEDTICTNPTQNIIVVSTPDEERANKYATVRSLFIGGKNYETYAYRTAPHGTAKGVIRGIALDATDEEIQNDIVHPANPTGSTGWKHTGSEAQRQW